MKEKEFATNRILQAVRKDFDESMLLEENCAEDPLVMFAEWLNNAMEKDSHYANAMTLCTANEDGLPDCRTVLLRNISYNGLTFFTNYRSAKGKQIEHNSKSCLLFFWKELQRQVKVQGEIRFLPSVESDAYFASRPFENQVAAWASHQSEPVMNRKTLDDLFDKELKKHAGKIVPRPEHWGGYVLLPASFEFWQGRSGRLHDRIRYTRQQDHNWKLERLMP